MYNTSLLDILRSFTPEEIKKFDDFLSSPYHNKKSAVKNLYKHIKKYAPLFQSTRLSYEKVWSGIYPGKDFHYGVLKNLIFDLTHLAEKFILFEYYQIYNFQMCYDLLDFLHERQIKNLFKSEFRRIKEEIDASYKSKNDVASGYHYYMSKMYLLKWSFSQQFDKNFGSTDDFDKHTVFQASSILYAIFNTSINALNFSGDYVYNKDENVLVSFVKKADSNNLISELIESIKPHSIEIYNIINAYHKYYKSVSDNTSIEKYLEFKEVLLIHSAEFSKPDKYILYSGLRNALTKLISCEINKSNELLEIVKLKIKDEVMLNPDGVIADSEFVTCIHAACEMKDSDFIIDFTEQFLKYLPKETMDNLQKYSLAHLNFTRNEFPKSLEIILTIKYDLFIMKYFLKNLQMMIYYELIDYDSFLLLWDSFKHFLSKNKSITEKWKSEQIPFGDFINRLFKLREHFDRFKLENIKEEIQTSNVCKKQWLLRKVNEVVNSQ